jgi:hypothetical protein
MMFCSDRLPGGAANRRSQSELVADGGEGLDGEGEVVGRVRRIV